jgi:hypothetical protein
MEWDGGNGQKEERMDFEFWMVEGTRMQLASMEKNGGDGRQGSKK